MKANRVPTADRIASRIERLNASIRYGDHWSSKKYYPECIYCGVTNVQCSIDGVHRKGCKVTGVLKEIAHYEALLKDLNSQLKDQN